MLDFFENVRVNRRNQGCNDQKIMYVRVNSNKSSNFGAFEVKLLLSTAQNVSENYIKSNDCCETNPEVIISKHYSETKFKFI